MAKKYFTDESLAALVEEIKTADAESLSSAKSYTDTEVAKKANTSHTHSISNVTDLQATLDGKVPTSRTINGKALSSNITLSASDVGAAASSHTHSSYANQNAFSNVKVGSTTVAADTTTDTLEIAAGTGISVSGDATNDKVTITNSGVRSISTGSSNGTISVNTNGTSANVAVKGLGSAAYTASTAYDAAGTAQTKADGALASAKSYTDEKIALLMDNSSEAVDSIMELATAMAENEDVVAALNDAIGTKVDKVSGKGLSTNDYTTTEKNKLAGIASGAQVNQNAFSNVKIGDTTIVADTTTDTLTLVAGSNITLTPDATGDSITIAATDTTYTLGSFGITATATELNYMDGVTSNVQTQLDGKQASITGGASTIASSNLTASRALISNSSGKVAVSAVTSTELGYLDGVTSAIQTQLDGKAASGHTHTTTIATSTSTNELTLAHGGKYAITAGGDSFVFTMPADNNTTYSAGTGISLSGTTFSNSGVRSISAGSTNGTISVNTGGTSAEVAVKGLGSAAYTNSSAYATASAMSTANTAISANTSSISSHSTAIANLQTAMNALEEITSDEITALFSA